MGDLAKKITDIALSCNNFGILEPAKIGESNLNNELLFFIKPEVFLLDERFNIENTVGLILDTLEKFNAKIDGIAAVNGRALDKYNIMASHYGFINVLSNSASSVVDQESRNKIESAFGISTGNYEILGGHEYLRKYEVETENQLDSLWFAEKSIKIRSGFYVRLIKKNGDNIVLVNGFHPKQLSYFTDPSHRIVLMLIHSDNSWYELKNKMVGATFPENADKNSIRGILCSNANKYGFKEVTIANNCVHLSAGPFEAFSEIMNFFGKLINADVSNIHPLILKRMLAMGISREDAIASLKNPKIVFGGKDTDLFTATEDKDTDTAIQIFKGSIGH